MSVPNVPIDIVQGEDWTVDVIWSDQYGQGVEVAHPCRMDIKDRIGNTLISLFTDPELPANEIPKINISPNIGLVQLHLTSDETSAFNPGDYQYDLFVTTGADTDYGGSQQHPLIKGTVTVHKRVTQL